MPSTAGFSVTIPDTGHAPQLEDPERARYYPEDDDFLLEKEELVTHAEVVLASGAHRR